MMSDRILYSSDVLSDAMVELKRLSGSLEEIAGDLSHVDTSGDWWDTIRFSSGRANGTARVVLHLIRAGVQKAAESVEAVTAGVDKTQTLLDEAERAAIAAAESVSALRDFDYERTGVGGAFGGYTPFGRGEGSGAVPGAGERGQGQQWGSWAEGSIGGSEVAPDGSSVSAWIAKGSAGFDIGSVNGEVNAYLGKIEAKREHKFLLYNKQYTLNPDGSVAETSTTVLEGTIGAGVSAEAASLDGRIKAGDDMFGSELSANGSVGNVGLSGEGTVSVGEDGLNAYLSGSAIASILEGELEGKINILGVEITATLGGYVGAVGVEGTAGIQDNIWKVEGGAAAGIGPKVGISIGPNEAGWDAFLDLLEK